MKMPIGFVLLRVSNPNDYVLELKRNLYGQHQASRVWVLFLSKGLRAIGFKQSAIDECVFYRGSTIFLVYVDDGLFFAPTDEDIDRVIDELRDAGFNVTDIRK